MYLERLLQYFVTENLSIGNAEKVIVSNIVKEAEDNFENKMEKIAFISAMVEEVIKIDEMKVWSVLAI